MVWFIITRPNQHLYAILLMFQKPTTNSSTSYDNDPEKDWRDKLFDECQDEFFETFGQYDGKGAGFSLLNYAI